MPRGLKVTDGFITDVKRHDLGIDPDFTHPAGDQLGVLRSEVEDQNAVAVDIHSCPSLSLNLVSPA